MFLIINQFEDTIEIGRLIVKSETPIFFYTEGVYLKFGLVGGRLRRPTV